MQVERTVGICDKNGSYDDKDDNYYGEKNQYYENTDNATCSAGAPRTLDHKEGYEEAVVAHRCGERCTDEAFTHISAVCRPCTISPVPKPTDPGLYVLGLLATVRGELAAIIASIVIFVCYSYSRRSCFTLEKMEKRQRGEGKAKRKEKRNSCRNNSKSLRSFCKDLRTDEGNTKAKTNQKQENRKLRNKRKQQKRKMKRDDLKMLHIEV